MKTIIFSAILLHLNWCYGLPDPRGVGVYAYQDSLGNRYGGSYGLDDKDIVRNSDPYFGQYPTVAQVPFLGNFADSFYPNYISNYDNILQEVFASNLEAQRLASYAAHKAYELTTNQIREFPNFSRFPSFGPIFGAGGLVPYDIMSRPNSAFASGAIGPGFSHQIAAINPENDAMRNIEVTNRFNDAPGNNKFYGVSSSSYSSSSNVNGKAQNLRGAETVVNNNGKITKYRVQDP
ncbi:uncharacterized protein LOC125059826 isoform X1 [Pieris napi]|uniref:uncharacterized protein LOC125059826 isoform X1 n=1 Tax=Pieris napi TaxID=78633 RepID=UPI001FB8AEBF|nr:uncharacterized protein LOC125059826 isoform X1 [Pieris napi]